jgi:phenylpyruvate tautomerase PptA (4-oxalocrotonate tautomerase family)
MTKQLRTEAELTAVIMPEVRKHDDCEHITGVAITQPEDQNWGVAWIRNGAKAAPKTAWDIAERFQNEFQLAT